MTEERKPPGPWKVWQGNPRRWKRPFLYFEWCCEWAVYSLRRWAFVELLEVGGRLAILVSIVTFALNYRAVQDSQRKAKHYQAWQVINLAHGKPGSAGRVDALKDLIRDGVSLARIDLRNADLSSANLSGADLSGANLSGTDLSFANLSGASLSAANLENADLSAANLGSANLSRANLCAANLSSGQLQRATLQGTTLSGANLSAAALSRASLWEANLSGANLSGASLDGTDLRRANLSGANLSGAFLGHADLRGALDLNCIMLETAKNWVDAFRDETLACAVKIP